MGRSKETFGKKEVRNKKEKKRKEKEQRRLEKKEQGTKGSFDDMIAYVDENGRISSTPPDPANKSVIKASSIEIAVPRDEFRQKEEKIRQGKVIYYDDFKGYGFISDDLSKQSVFVHVNDCEDKIKVNDAVEFEVEKSPKGPKAVQVKVVTR